MNENGEHPPTADDVKGGLPLWAWVSTLIGAGAALLWLLIK